jgi:hypothetical protein
MQVPLGFKTFIRCPVFCCNGYLRNTVFYNQFVAEMSMTFTIDYCRYYFMQKLQGMRKKCLLTEDENDY